MEINSSFTFPLVPPQSHGCKIRATSMSADARPNRKHFHGHRRSGAVSEDLGASGKLALLSASPLMESSAGPNARGSQSPPRRVLDNNSESTKFSSSEPISPRKVAFVDPPSPSKQYVTRSPTFSPTKSPMSQNSSPVFQPREEGCRHEGVPGELSLNETAEPAVSPRRSRRARGSFASIFSWKKRDSEDPSPDGQDLLVLPSPAVFDDERTPPPPSADLFERPVSPSIDLDEALRFEVRPDSDSLFSHRRSESLPLGLSSPFNCSKRANTAVVPVVEEEEDTEEPLSSPPSSLDDEQESSSSRRLASSDPKPRARDSLQGGIVGLSILDFSSRGFPLSPGSLESFGSASLPSTGPATPLQKSAGFSAAGDFAAWSHKTAKVRKHKRGKSLVNWVRGKRTA